MSLWDVGCGLSQRRRIAERAFPGARTKHRFGGNVDPGVQQILEIHEQTSKIHQTAVRRKVYQEIIVARVFAVASRDRPENPHIRGDPTGGQFENALPLRDAKLLKPSH